MQYLNYKCIKFVLYVIFIKFGQIGIKIGTKHVIC